MRRKPQLDNRLEKCAHLLISKPDEVRGRWLEEFSFNNLHIELGCGKGLFTAETAKADPDVLLIALEKTSNVLVLAMERVERDGLRNVLFINRFADDITSFFDNGEASRIYINFCDPWPARRQAKRRLTGQGFLERYKQVLDIDGEIHFKTDNLPLFDFSLNEFKRSGFALSDVSYDLHKTGPTGIMTDYEKKFHEEGMPIYRCVAIKESLHGSN